MREGYSSFRVSLSVFVCVSVKSHLTSGASVRRENAATYSVGNEGQESCGVFSENVQLQRLSATSLDGYTSGRPFFLQKTRMRIVDLLYASSRQDCTISLRDYRKLSLHSSFTKVIAGLERSSRISDMIREV